MNKRLWLHIRFTNGANPYVKYGTKEELDLTLEKWNENYFLTVVHVKDDDVLLGYDVWAMEKDPTIEELFGGLYEETD